MRAYVRRCSTYVHCNTLYFDDGTEPRIHILDTNTLATPIHPCAQFNKLINQTNTIYIFMFIFFRFVSSFSLLKFCTFLSLVYPHLFTFYNQPLNCFVCFLFIYLSELRINHLENNKETDIYVQIVDQWLTPVQLKEVIS